MILVIDNYDSFTFNLVQSLGTMVDEVRVVRNDAMTVHEIQGLRPDAIVISPGPGRPEDAGVSLELVRYLGGTIPILGVCLGHQVIAEAYGGQVVPAVRLMHGKADHVIHHQDGLMCGLADRFLAGRYHSLSVQVEGVSELRVDAVSDDGTVMALSHQRDPIYGLQFHPESILTPEGPHILKNFLLKVGLSTASDPTEVHS